MFNLEQPTINGIIGKFGTKLSYILKIGKKSEKNDFSTFSDVPDVVEEGKYLFNITYYIFNLQTNVNKYRLFNTLIEDNINVSL